MKRMGSAVVALALSAWTLTVGTADAQETMGPTMTGTSGMMGGNASVSSSFSVDAESSDLDRAANRATEIGRRYGQVMVSDHDTILLSSLGLEGRLESGERVPGSFTVTRFDRDEDGNLVAYGLVTSTPVTPSLALAIRDPNVDITTLSAHERALLLSTPIEVAEYEYTPEELGLSGDVIFEEDLGDVEFGIVDDGSGMPMDEHDVFDARFGSWTGISTGYGESGVGPSVNYDMTSDGISGLTDDETLYTEPSLGLAWRTEQDAYILAPSLTITESELDGGVLAFEDDEVIIATPFALQEVSTPVTIVSSSCDHLTLGLGDVMVNGTAMSFNKGTLTIMSRPGDEEFNARLCAISDTHELTGSDVDLIIEPLNGLIITAE